LCQFELCIGYLLEFGISNCPTQMANNLRRLLPFSLLPPPSPLLPSSSIPVPPCFSPPSSTYTTSSNSTSTPPPPTFAATSSTTSSTSSMLPMQPKHPPGHIAQKHIPSLFVQHHPALAFLHSSTCPFVSAFYAIMRFSVTGTAAAQHKEFVTGAPPPPPLHLGMKSKPPTPNQSPSPTLPPPCSLTPHQAWRGVRLATFYLRATTRPCASGPPLATAAARYYNRTPVVNMAADYASCRR
jgi:hypothetical protein